jgi:KUP system potassium uptake protein
MQKVRAMADATETQPGGKAGDEKPFTRAAAVAALGIVYGDLGTSPLYTMQTVVGAAGGHITGGDAMGILSLIVWALLITVSLKYCVFVMRADNHGEGGILALMSLISGGQGRTARLLVYCGLFGAALIYGDGVITPAISVLSALEGVKVVSNALTPYVLPVGVLVLLILFASQTLGTARIGRVFGPVMLLWFAVIALLGLAGLVHRPGVLLAIDPSHAVGFLVRHGWASFIVLGGVFLAITGGEALYADMGHIGRVPIRASWYGVVLPALLLSYAGQTALLMDKPDTTDNPFFLLAPSWAVYPLVALAAVATIIASQSIITGTFSLTRQAMQLGWLPGMKIRQTSDEEYGQIYVPLVNWLMMAVTVAITVSFGSSDRLAGAYGTAVATTMLLTTALLFTVMRERWGWSIAAAAPVALGFLIIDIAFFAANLLKIADGGWVPLLLAALIFGVMLIWHRGSAALRRRHYSEEAARTDFLRRLGEGAIPRVPGTAVFLTGAPFPVSQFIMRHVEQFGALAERLASLRVQFAEVPRVAPEERVAVSQVAPGFWHIVVRYGFMEVPSLPAALAAARAHGCGLDLHDAVYLGARDEAVSGPDDQPMPVWQRVLFSFMNRNAVHPIDRFDLPAHQFLGISRRYEI